MSWGLDEFSGETAFDGYFTQRSVVYFAGAGDGGSLLYPSASPNVVSVGGTSLVRNLLTWRGNLGDFQGEAVWNWGSAAGTGAGPAPTSRVPVIRTRSGTSSEACVGLPTSPQLPTPPPAYGFTKAVGSSSVAPASPPRYGLASSMRPAGSTAPRLPSSPKSIRGHLRSRRPLEALNDIDSGTCGMGSAGVFDTYLATSGWDFCTGVGSPLGYFCK